ncbi:uncharacterized protein LOC101735359 isoform X5 [Bombyx mori]|uniref:Uncharacterized protein n=1 Tax=Bombyx mori TaxID=7091 RepID=A0A8R2RAV4_BOMMO|nr:uncharacterized protein LOC101735359 isoform X4 [Bombyx mori]
MDLAKLLEDLPWIKLDWCFPSMTQETNELIQKCTEIPEIEPDPEVDEIIERSKNFPIPFPIQTVRLEKLKEHRPIDRLKRNISETYPIIHERVLLLMAHFLIYKREHGSSIEKELYRDMTIPELIDRLLLKRAVSFMGARDAYMLMSGKKGVDGWENVGTPAETEPLVLKDVLSYDEIKLSAFLFVSGPTECINSGSRRNCGVLDDDDIEKEAIIIGAIGPRFKRLNRMDYEDMVISKTQNTAERGYGEHEAPTRCMDVLRHAYTRDASLAKRAWRQLWAELYQVHSYTYEELSARLAGAASDRYVKLPRGGAWFDNEVYYKRICILAETVLLEAEGRARGRSVFLNVVGCGGVSVQLEDREPASRLHGRHRGKLLVLTYPWDGNAQPGNEFWKGKLKSSGDPAAACSTQVAELHNPHVNPRAASRTARVAARDAVLPLRTYAGRR